MHRVDETERPDERGIVTGRRDAADTLQEAQPEQALGLLHRRAESRDAVIEATRELLKGSRRALKEGALVLSVPSALAGGRLGWTAPAGQVREVISQRMQHLNRQGQLTREDCKLLARRFALHGYPGGAREARLVTGKRRQATTDAVNHALQTLAADIALQPLLPIRQPMLARAQREEIVGTVLSTMEGPPGDRHLRRYVHARVRKILLDDPVTEVPMPEARDRQRAHRAVSEWVAIASDHLERGRLPWSEYPSVGPFEEAELLRWRHQQPEPNSEVTLSLGALRALTARRLDDAWNDTGRSSQMLAVLTDGYRPLLELTRVARWASEDKGGMRATASEPTWSAACMLLALAHVVAARGYYHLAVAYAGTANRIVSRAGGVTSTAGADLRFRVGLTYEEISYLQGPGKVAETRAWQARLASDLNRRGAQEPGFAMALAQAIIRTEHSAVNAGIGSGASVAQLLAPIRGALDEAIPRAPMENKVRLAIVLGTFAERIHDRQALHDFLRVAGTYAPIIWEKPATRRDEWYCASPVARARWEPRPKRDTRDLYRR